MTESYLAAVFATREQAEAAQEALTRLAEARAVVLYGTRLYARSASGDLEPITQRSITNSALLDPASLPGGSDDEAIDELEERLPEGYCALLAHVSESEPSIVDAAMRSAGGTVYRRAMEEVEASGFDRFLGASSM